MSSAVVTFEPESEQSDVELLQIVCRIGFNLACGDNLPFEMSRRNLIIASNGPMRRIVSITDPSHFTGIWYKGLNHTSMRTFAPCSGMQHITVLWLTELSLKSLSLEITQLQNLQSFGAAYNDIDFSSGGDAHAVIDSLTKLQTLHIQSNRFFDGDLQWHRKPKLNDFACDMQHVVIDLFQPPTKLVDLQLYKCQTVTSYTFIERLTLLQSLKLETALPTALESLRLETLRELEYYHDSIATTTELQPIAHSYFNYSNNHHDNFIVTVHRRQRWLATERLIDLVVAFGPLQLPSLILAHFCHWTAECDRITFVEKMEFIRGVNERLRRLRTNARGLRVTPARISSAIRRKLTWNN